jgi:hypothetical protein
MIATRLFLFDILLKGLVDERWPEKQLIDVVTPRDHDSSICSREMGCASVPNPQHNRYVQTAVLLPASERLHMEPRQSISISLAGMNALTTLRAFVPQRYSASTCEPLLISPSVATAVPQLGGVRLSVISFTLHRATFRESAGCLTSSEPAAA